MPVQVAFLGAQVWGATYDRVNNRVFFIGGSATKIVSYPLGQTDIDGLAIGPDGIAYLIIDQPGFIYRYHLDAGIYLDPIPSPWTEAELFSSGTWIDRGSAIFSDGFETVL